MIEESAIEPRPGIATALPGGPAGAPAVQAAPTSEGDAPGNIASEAEAEIKHLIQELHDKIVALGGENWITTIGDDLRQARSCVEQAAEWIVEHFHKQAQ